MGPVCEEAVRWRRRRINARKRTQRKLINRALPIFRGMLRVLRYLAEDLQTVAPLLSKHLAPSLFTPAPVDRSDTGCIHGSPACDPCVEHDTMLHMST